MAIEESFDALVESDVQEDIPERPKFLSREAILGLEDSQYATIVVPEWGGASVMIRGLSANERDRYEASIVQGSGKTAKIVSNTVRATLVALTVIDPDTKKPMFSRQDVERLGQKSAAALERIFDEARKLSGMTEADVAELEKN